MFHLIFGLAFGLTALVWAACDWRRHGISPAQASQAFQVHGSSMAPTLVGQHRVAQCDVCQFRWRVEPTRDPEAANAIRCFHCGIAGTVGSEVQQADVIRLVDVSPQQLAAGDLVAIRWDGRIRVKRVAALAGDSVALDGSMLLVNGQRLNERFANRGVEVPRFLVDDDQRRGTSHWVPLDPLAWQRSAQSSWDFGPPAKRVRETSWLVYTHLSVHDENVPSPVWDDYPFNTSVRRRLQVIDRFTVRGRSRCAAPTTLDLAFWSGQGSGITRLEFPQGEHAFVAQSVDAIDAEEVLPTNAERPIAIRSSGPIALSGLTIERPIQYRLRPSDDRDQYPLTVQQGALFVLGDNVPVSVDSRDWGLLPSTDVLGKATKVVASEH